MKVQFSEFHFSFILLNVQMQAIWWECTQEQNEIIFVPSGWYHQVHNQVSFHGSLVLSKAKIPAVVHILFTVKFLPV